MNCPTQLHLVGHFYKIKKKKTYPYLLLSHTEHVNALGGQNDEFLILKQGYIYYPLGVKETRIR